jgi:hypothetical protein
MRRALVLLVAAMVLPGCAGGITDGVSHLTDTSATLNGQIGSSLGGSDYSGTEYWFKYGARGQPLRQTPHRTVVLADQSAYPVAVRIPVAPQTTYGFKLCAKDPDQATEICASKAVTFTTE